MEGEEAGGQSRAHCSYKVEEAEGEVEEEQEEEAQDTARWTLRTETETMF